MYAHLDMALSTEKELSYQMASSFHGALMELLDPDYAEVLHSSSLHPYAQHLEKRNGEWHWVVSVLNEDAEWEIIEDNLLYLEKITLDKHQMEIRIANRQYTEISERELFFSVYEQKQSPYISIRFLTPTAFKYQGRYVNYPDIRFMYSNLMKKYNTAQSEETMQDEDTLEQLVMSTSVSRYDLHSVNFSMEGIRIPAFVGTLTLRIHGAQTVHNFANMLFRFGEYSGVGIKTGLGMGAIRLENNRENENNGGSVQ